MKGTMFGLARENANCRPVSPYFGARQYSAALSAVLPTRVEPRRHFAYGYRPHYSLVDPPAFFFVIFSTLLALILQPILSNNLKSFSLV